MKGTSLQSKRSFRVLDEHDDDPMLSIINLVDVFLVAIGILLIGAAMRSAIINQSVSKNGASIVRSAGTPEMELLLTEGNKVSRLKSSGLSVDGDGERIGTAYRLKDGTVVYVPRSKTNADQTSE